MLVFQVQVNGESVRIVSWNMNQRGRDTCAFLFQKLDPDIALVQEAILPEDLPDGYQPLWTPALLNGRWGSAILSRVGKLVPDLQEHSGGAVLVAHCPIPPLGVLSIASIHARVMDDGVIRALRETFDRIRPYIGERFIVGGDLNTARAAALAWPAYGHGEFWADLDAWGFRDCYYSVHAAEQQSFWRKGLRTPLMDDHILVDGETFEHVMHADVFDTPEVRMLSDHAPIVVDIALPGEGHDG